LNFGGTPLQVLNLARAGFAGVLRDKSRWREDDIADGQQEIRSFANHVTPAEALTLVVRLPRGISKVKLL
jgi:hypothetical protein